MSISGIGPRMGLYPQALNAPQNNLQTQRAATTQPLLQGNQSPAPQQAPNAGQIIQEVLKSFLESLGQRRGGPASPNNTESPDNSLMTYSRQDFKQPAFGGKSPEDLGSQQFALAKLSPVGQTQQSNTINPFMQAKLH